MKKRGVLLSTTTHHPNKSSSAHPLPPPQGNDEEHLLTEDPPRMVNQAYYTYQDPDSLQQQRRSEHSEENEEHVIQSMQKKQQELLRQQKEEQERIRIGIKAKNQMNRASNNKHRSTNKLTPSNQGKRTAKSKETQSRQKVGSKGAEIRLERKELNRAILKPKPLVFSVNMFAKGNFSPRQRENTEQVYARLSERIEGSRKVMREEPTLEESQGQSLNCKKLPFRFSGVI